MRPTSLAAWAFLLIACLPEGLAAAQPDARAVRDELLARERALAATLGTRARDDMERLLADDFVLRGSPDVPRETWIREALTRCWGDRFDIDDFSARVEGDTAVASFLLTFYVHPDTCAPAVLRSLVTDVWTRVGDVWRLRVRHSSAPPAGGVASQFGLVPEIPPRWILSSELSLVATAGNTSTRTLGAGSDLRHQQGGATSRLQFTYVSSVAEGVTRARATTFQGRHGIRIRQGVEIFGRAAYARDVFAGIGNRAAFDGGVAVSTGRPPRHRVTLEGGAGATVEDRIGVETLRFGAGTGTVRYAWQVAAGSELQEELSVTVDLGRPANWRATNALALSLGLTRLLSLKVASGVEYRHQPVPGFRRADMRTSAALVVTFRAR